MLSAARRRKVDAHNDALAYAVSMDAAEGRWYPTAQQLRAMLDAGQLCRGCGERLEVEIWEMWTEDRAFTFWTCCEGSHEDTQEAMREWDRKDWARWFADEAGVQVRQVVTEPQALEYAGQWMVDFGLQVVDVPLDAARAFVGEYHRHNVAPQGWRWGHAAENGADLVAVATVGRPVARGIDHRTLVEVTRLCVDPNLDPALVWNACSQLYGAAAQEAEARGFQGVITYTMDGEDATSLRAAGYVLVDAQCRPVDPCDLASRYQARVIGRSWDTPSRRRDDKAPTVNKWRWGRVLKPAARMVAERYWEQADRDARNARERARVEAKAAQLAA
jgi:hypothetical protein